MRRRSAWHPHSLQDGGHWAWLGLSVLALPQVLSECLSQGLPRRSKPCRFFTLGLNTQTEPGLYAWSHKRPQGLSQVAKDHKITQTFPNDLSLRVPTAPLAPLLLTCFPEDHDPGTRAPTATRLPTNPGPS